MFQRLLYFPLWLLSVVIEQLSRSVRGFFRILFGLSGTDDGEDEIYDDPKYSKGNPPSLRRRLKRLRPYLIWSLAFLMIIGTAGYLFYYATRDYKHQIAKRYQIALAEAVQSEDIQKADLFRKKLNQLGVKTEAGEYLNALAVANKDGLAAAYEEMKLIATPENPGYAAAHFWQAQNLIEGQFDMPAQESLTLALKHLEQLKTRTGKLSQVRFLEGVAYAMLGKPKAAINSLELAKELSSVEMLTADALLMELRQKTGETRKAKSDALTVQLQLSRKKDAGEKLSEGELKWQAYAARLLGDPKVVADAVEQWYVAHPDNQEASLNQAMVQMRTVNEWLDEADDRWLGDPEDIPVEQLSQAASLTPVGGYEMVRGALSRIWKMKKDSSTVQDFYDLLMPEDSTADESILPGKAIEFFGTLAATEGDWATADELLGRATETDPQWSEAWNNRAFVIREAFPDRLDEAVRYANRAIEIQPNNAEFRETRGMLYFKLERWKLAVVDLDIAVNGLVGQSKAIHSALSVAHGNLGNERLAEVHRAAGR